MNIKFLNPCLFVFAVIVASGSWGSCSVAQSAAKQTTGQIGQTASQGSGATQVKATEVAAVNPLMDPSRANVVAPDKFRAKFNTTRGVFVVEVTRAWAPNGADRFYNMCRSGYFNDIAIFRSIRGFMFQFGIHGDPVVSQKWLAANIKDDKPINISNERGTLSFAQTGRPNSRSVQMFVNTANNDFLDKAAAGENAPPPYLPFGKIVSGISVIDKIYITKENEKDVQGKFRQGGNEYIKAKYPHADYIRSVEISVTN